SQKKLRNRNKSTLTPLIFLLAGILQAVMPFSSFGTPPPPPPTPPASFGTATNFTAGAFPESVAVGDFNGDGKPDLAVANESGNTVSIFLGTGPGTFGPATTLAVGINPAFVAIGDFNGDG